jgi:hypothetical protein
MVWRRVARRRRYPVAVAKKRGRGRPKHTDDPPVILATTIPKSLDKALREHAKATGRPRSEHLAEAIRTYLKRSSVATRKTNRRAGAAVEIDRR